MCMGLNRCQMGVGEWRFVLWCLESLNARHWIYTGKILFKIIWNLFTKVLLALVCVPGWETIVNIAKMSAACTNAYLIAVKFWYDTHNLLIKTKAYVMSLYVYLHILTAKCRLVEVTPIQFFSIRQMRLAGICAVSNFMQHVCWGFDTILDKEGQGCWILAINKMESSFL